MTAASKKGPHGFGIDIHLLRQEGQVRRQVTRVGGRQVFAPQKPGRTRKVPLSASMDQAHAAHIQPLLPVPVTLLREEAGGSPVTARLLLVSREDMR